MEAHAVLLDAIQHRDRAQEALDAAALAVSDAVLTVVAQGTSQSELAGMLGMSRQRVSQLVKRSHRAAEEAHRDMRAASYGLATADPDNRGLASGSIPCMSCGSFKPSPAAVCGQCGDDPVSYNGDVHEFNRAYGYAS